MAGLHRSPLRGHSIEFAQHREYVPGDDLRQVDWKVYARSDRYYLKQYEDETSLNVCMLLDQSESMRYQGQHSPLSKLEYAQLYVCSLAYLTILQQDSVELVTFSADIDDWLPASSTPNQIEDIVKVMESQVRTPKTRISSVIERVLFRLNRPSLLILLSDLFDELDEVLRALRLVRHAGHDLVVFHILDRDEIQFPFDRMTQFDGLEASHSLTADPLMIASAYRSAMREFQNQIRQCCRRQETDYFDVVSDQSLSQVLPQFLALRNRGTR